MPETGHRTGNSRSASGNAPAARAFVRVTGMHLGRYLEFDFSLNDEDLTVQLVMPVPAFEEFCAAHQAEILPPAPEAAAALAGLGSGAAAGLYRPPSFRDDEDDGTARP